MGENRNYPDFGIICFGEPFIQHDCNDCKWLNITESDQERVKRRTLATEHACLFYGTRVIHWANNIRHDPFIFPCQECVDDEFKYIERRG